MQLPLDLNIADALLVNCSAHDSCMEGLAHAGALAAMSFPAARPGQYGGAVSNNFANINLAEAGRIIEANGAKRFLCTLRPNDIALLNLSQASILSGHIATIQRTLGVNLTSPGADRLLTQRLEGFRDSGFDQMITSATKTSPQNILRLQRMGSAMGALRGVGIDPMKATAGEEVGGLLQHLRAKGTLSPDDNRQFPISTFGQLSKLETLSLGVKPFVNNTRIIRSSAAAPAELNFKVQALSGTLMPICQKILSGLLCPGFRFPAFRELAALNALLAGLRALSTATGIKITDQTANARLRSNLQMIRAGGACRAIAQAPLSSAQAAGLGYRYAVASAFRRIEASTGIDLLHQDAGHQLAAMTSEFSNTGERDPHTNADITNSVLPALSSVAQLGMAMANARAIAS
jgi:hypothetical protein